MNAAPPSQDQHFVNLAPFNPYSVEQLTPTQEKLYLAPPWKLMWWKFRRHKLAYFSAVFLLVCYFSICICEFIAPYTSATTNLDMLRSPPQAIHLFHQGQFVGPFVYGEDHQLNLTTLKHEYSDNNQQIYKLRFFCRGEPYRFWGLVEGDFHLFCPAENGYVYLFGTDRM